MNHIHAEINYVAKEYWAFKRKLRRQSTTHRGSMQQNPAGKPVCEIKSSQNSHTLSNHVFRNPNIQQEQVDVHNDCTTARGRLCKITPKRNQVSICNTTADGEAAQDHSYNSNLTLSQNHMRNLFWDHFIRFIPAKLHNAGDIWYSAAARVSAWPSNPKPGEVRIDIHQYQLTYREAKGR